MIRIINLYVTEHLRSRQAGWRVKRFRTLQTDADCERVIEGLASGDRKADQVFDNTVQQLAKRWFVMRDMHAGPAPVLLQPRYAMTYMRGPMTRSECA